MIGDALCPGQRRSTLLYTQNRRICHHGSLVCHPQYGPFSEWTLAVSHTKWLFLSIYSATTINHSGPWWGTRHALHLNSSSQKTRNFLSSPRDATADIVV